jgi:hypothetical protein
MQGTIYYFNRIFLKIITPIPQRSIEHKLPNSPLHPQHGDGKREFRKPVASGAEDGVPTLVGVNCRKLRNSEMKQTRRQGARADRRGDVKIIHNGAGYK